MPAFTDTPLPVVPRSQVRVAEPVVGDVDPLGVLEAVRPGDIGMMASKEGAPRDLDRLARRVGGQLESRVEIVAG